MRRIYTSILCLAGIALHNPAEAMTVHGRVDAGPAAVQVKVIELGRTTNTINMGGARVDATILPIDGSGFCLKPMVFGAWGDGNLYSAALGVGHYTPFCEKWSVTPLIGVSYTHLHTDIDVPAYGLTNVRETFRSRNFYAGAELGYRINCDWAITGIFQYAWASTNTEIEVLGDSDGHSEGINLGLVLDYFICENLTVNLAAGYNNSMSKEKFGLKAAGLRLGIGWIF